MESSGAQESQRVTDASECELNPSYSVRVEYQKFLDVGDDRTGERDIDRIDVAILFR
jgi:hypothetical protein